MLKNINHEEYYSARSHRTAVERGNLAIRMETIYGMRQKTQLEGVNNRVTKLLTINSLINKYLYF
ncbi:hypothetical protein AVENLUH7437_01706 [Acinetobacter venetianus]|nr:hypothetical protein AVENLUH7437_01706 [Acinetobacter venetianus]